MASSSTLPPPKISLDDITKRHRLERRNPQTRKSMTSFNEFLSELTPDDICESDRSSLVPHLQTWIKNERLRRSVLLVVDKMVRGGAHAAFGSTFWSWIMDVEGILKESSEFEVKASALKASFGFMLYPANPDCDQQLQALLGHVTSKTFEKGIKSDWYRERLVQGILEELNVLATVKPWFLKEQLYTVILFVFEIMDSTAYQDRTRHLALEFLLALAEGRERFGESVLLSVENKFVVGTMLSQLLTMIEDIDDEKTGDMFTRGINYFTRFSSIGAIYLLQTFPGSFAITSTEWRNRFAVATALSILPVKNHQELKQRMDLVVEPALKATSDDDRRVRQAGMTAMKEFSFLLAPEFQQQYHDKVLPVLTKAMIHLENHGTRVMALTAMTLFCKKCASDALTPHVDQIITQLLKCLEEEKEDITREALYALGSIAYSSKNQMQGHYETVIPYLKVIRMQAAAEQNYKILAAIINSITVIWKAIGKDRIGHDIDMVVDTLILLDGSKLEWDNPMRYQVLHAWGRLCKCLGQDSLCYMSVFVPRLLHSARLEEPVSNSNPSVNKDILEEKTTACKVLFDCVAVLKEDFDLWIHEVAETIVPFLGVKFGTGTEYISGMREILKWYKALVDKEKLKRSSLQNICSSIASLVLPDFNKFPVKFYPLNMELLEECMEIAGPILDADQIRYFLDVLVVKVLKATSISISGNEEYIDQVKRASEKSEQSFITVLKTHNTFSSQFFDYLQSCISQMWGKDSTETERRITLLMFKGIVGQFKGEAIEHFEINLPELFEACRDPNTDVVKVAAQAIGYSAEFGGSSFARHARVALTGLSAILNHPELWEGCEAYDAAVSAFSKICLFHLDDINALEALDLLLNHLPERKETEEAAVAHDMFCCFVSKLNDTTVWGDKVSLGKTVTIFLQILWSNDNLTTKEAEKTEVKVLKELRETVASETWESMLTTFPPSRRCLLEHYLSC